MADFPHFFQKALDFSATAKVSGALLSRGFDEMTFRSGYLPIVSQPTAPDTDTYPGLKQVLWRDSDSPNIDVYKYIEGTGWINILTLPDDYLNDADQILDGIITLAKLAEPGTENAFLMSNAAGDGYELRLLTAAIPDGSLAIAKIALTPGTSGRLLRVKTDGSGIEWFVSRLASLDPTTATAGQVPVVQSDKTVAWGSVDSALTKDSVLDAIGLLGLDPNAYLGPAGASVGEVLVWNGSSWEPQTFSASFANKRVISKVELGISDVQAANSHWLRVPKTSFRVTVIGAGAPASTGGGGGGGGEAIQVTINNSNAAYFKIKLGNPAGALADRETEFVLYNSAHDVLGTIKAKGGDGITGGSGGSCTFTGFIRWSGGDGDPVPPDHSGDYWFAGGNSGGGFGLGEFANRFVRGDGNTPLDNPSPMFGAGGNFYTSGGELYSQGGWGAVIIEWSN